MLFVQICVFHELTHESNIVELRRPLINVWDAPIYTHDNKLSSHKKCVWNCSCSLCHFCISLFYKSLTDVTIQHQATLSCTQRLSILTRAPLGYSAERAPLRGADSAPPPCLTSERRVVERRGKRQTKGLNKADLKSTFFLLSRSQVRSRSGQRSKLQVFIALASEPRWRRTD